MEEIKHAHRKQARQSHPDRNPGDGAAARQFVAVQSAYEQIDTAQKRRAYDIRRLAVRTQPSPRPAWAATSSPASTPSTAGSARARTQATAAVASARSQMDALESLMQTMSGHATITESHGHDSLAKIARDASASLRERGEQGRQKLGHVAARWHQRGSVRS
jgi:DnaJ-class molecular chaperone